MGAAAAAGLPAAQATSYGIMAHLSGAHNSISSTTSSVRLTRTHELDNALLGFTEDEINSLAEFACNALNSTQEEISKNCIGQCFVTIPPPLLARLEAYCKANPDLATKVENKIKGVLMIPSSQ
ncbi:hypothetical protein BDV06DRAFT_228311 [Aspergillus oleicola]